MAASKLRILFQGIATQLLLRKKTGRIILTREIQNSCNLLIIFLAADGGWPPAANFILVKHLWICVE